jgi:NAD(P)-dependent dehydrogenase (short-subunit alcohol dehydrogenase family)
VGEDIHKTRNLAGRIAVVTGATSGVGRAISLALAGAGAEVCVIGRNAVTLAETVAAVQQLAGGKGFQIDLTVEESFEPLARYLNDEYGKLDVLILSAATIHLDNMETARIEDFDDQFATNVRAPYLLTQKLLPLLIAGCGQIVFINSPAALMTTRADLGQYGATKHALKAIADSLRTEVNPRGVRVTSVYLGRTATPMQESLFKKEGRPYQPELLLQPEDVATVVIHALMLPLTAEVADINLRAMQKSY